jgi:glycoside/pentoside/hexuronide:cation symporter, GPH family
VTSQGTEVVPTVEAGAAAVRPPIPRSRTKLFYALGSIAFGVKDNGFGVFLLLYYNQVLGLSAALAGTALVVALFVDAFIDPVVGHLSDNLHSRWGRRHPFMYAAALPIALVYAMLWNPPHLGQQALFFYLLFGTILVRTLITCYEIPSAALAAELTDDYDERTSYVSLRWFFGASGGLLVGVFALRVLMQPTAAQPVGTLNPEGYHLYGVIAGAIMLAAILTSAIGTHHAIPHLRKPPPKVRRPLRETARILWQTLSTRAVLVLFGCGFIWAIAAGILTALGIYLQTYFWELSAKQISIAGMGTIVAYGLSLLATTWWAKRWGKKAAAIIGGIGWIVLGPAPIWLRLVGFFPENGSPWLLPTLMAFWIAHTAVGVVSAMLVGSMMADVAEAVELKTGRRSEGLLFSANAFVAKATSGVGLFTSGAVLAIVNFPAHAQPGHVSQTVLDRLAWSYSIIILLLYSAALVLLGAYNISRSSHAAAVQELARRRASA